jgi:Predicted hydrolases or acyltransferases (alpha/beta hydrolase superfamily)
MEEKIILFKGNRVGYRIIGKGPAVVLVHGFGEDGMIWDNQYTNLKGYRFIVPDLPGNGLSSPVNETSMEEMAEALFNIIQSEITSNQLAFDEKVVLIGHSMGGYVTLSFAEKYPDTLKGFGLFHSTSYSDTEEKKKTRLRGMQFIKDHGAYEFLKTAIPNLYSPITKENNPQIIEEQLGRSHNFSPESLVSYYEAMIARKSTSFVLQDAQCPVLFVLGKYDMAVPLKDGLEQCKLPDFSYIHILENSAHMGMREEVKDANQILYNFLENIFKS